MGAGGCGVVRGSGLGWWGRRLSDPAPGAVSTLLLPPLAHVIEGEEQQTCRQRFDYIFHASVKWKSEAVVEGWGGRPKEMQKNLSFLHACGTLILNPCMTVTGCSDSAALCGNTSPSIKGSVCCACSFQNLCPPRSGRVCVCLCVCLCALMHIIALPITRASAPSTTTSSMTTGAISTFVAAAEE